MPRKWVTVSTLFIGFLLVTVLSHQRQRDGGSGRRQDGRAEGTSFRSDRWCGPKALHTAFALLGEPVRLDDLKKDIRCGHSGTTFGALRSAAAKRGYRAVLRRCTWQEMQSSGTTAILWVKRNHFIAVDTRPRAGSSGLSGEETVDVYDSDTPVEGWTRAQMEAVWTGEALILSAPPRKSKRPQRPRMDWERCVVDGGFIARTDQREFRFAFHNSGGLPLTVKVLGASCSCAKAALTDTDVGTGQAAELAVTIDPTGKRGFFISEVAVASNDPTAPLSFVYVRGFVGNRHAASVRYVRVDDLPRGQAREERFAIHAAGHTTADIGKPQLEWSNAINGRPLYSRVRCWRIGRNDLAENMRLDVKPGDYVISLTVYAGTDCPAGDFSGVLRFPTSLLVHEEPLDIPFTGTVVSDMSIRPGAAFLRPREDGTAVAEFSLSRLSNRALDFKGVTATGGLSIEDVDVKGNSLELRLGVLVRGIRTSDQVSAGTFRFKVNHDVIDVPVVLGSLSLPRQGELKGSGASS